MSGLDISERRLPQDGRFNVKVRDQQIDVRISSMPTQYGEAIVMRLLHSAGVCNNSPISACRRKCSSVSAARSTAIPGWCS